MRNKVFLKIICLTAALVLLTGFSAFADDNIPTITDVSGYTAELYLSDWADGGVVLKNVKPIAETPETAAVAAQLEYSEVSVFEGNIYSKTGAELDLSSLAWYLDMNVKFVAAHLSNGGYRIIYLVTQ